MTKTCIIFLIFVWTGCTSSVSKKENKLAKELGTFLISGKYDVQVIEGEGLKSTKSIKAQLTLTNNPRLIEFKGKDSFTDLDSISIILSDSTLLRQFSMNPFMDTVSVSADKSGFGEEYFGYAFGEDNSRRGIANIPEFRHFFNKTNISGSQALFIIGRTKKNNNIIIKRNERVVNSGQILLDVNKTFILTPNYSYFDQQ